MPSLSNNKSEAETPVSDVDIRVDSNNSSDYDDFIFRKNAGIMRRKSTLVSASEMLYWRQELSKMKPKKMEELEGFIERLKRCGYEIKVRRQKRLLP